MFVMRDSFCSAARPAGGSSTHPATTTTSEGQAELDSRMAYGMPSTYPPVHICGHESTPPSPCCVSAGRRLHVGCGIGARRARSVEVDTWARGTAGLSRGYH